MLSEPQLLADEVINWSGSIRFRPDVRSCPADEREVAEVVRRGAEEGRMIRPIGAAHSSMPLFQTDDVLLSLERLEGVVDVDRDDCLATVLPGTGMAALGAELAAHGLALANMGDVDYQAIAGAVGTGTHGSGARFGSLSSMLVGGRLITATGAVVPFGAGAADDDGDLLRAAQVSMGALGVLSALTLRVEPAHRLHRLNWCTTIDWVLDHFDELVRRNRHFDFYWYPRSDMAQVRTMNLPGEEPDLVPPGDVHADETGPSHEVIPNQRDLRYEEMEHMVPYEAGLDCFRAARERIKERHRSYVGWRVLVRTIAADDAMLSPCHGRATMSIALLQNRTLPYRPYFEDMEPLLRDHDGRPHWGKKHTMTASQLSACYPDWDRFQTIRSSLDPSGVFLNDHLAELFGAQP